MERCFGADLPPGPRPYLSFIPELAGGRISPPVYTHLIQAAGKRTPQSMSLVVQELPLSLYIHVPWCMRKCPYCDFNSHAMRDGIPETIFVEALLEDLDSDLDSIVGRSLESVFIGGGTPSLLSGGAVNRLLNGVRGRCELTEDCEITLEANPGTTDAERFAAYREAGVNRLSIGVQTFDADQLADLGRIHGPREALGAARQAREAGFERINLDLMFGLPGHTESQARSDLEKALALNPGHISYYQLTLEPNTLFYRRPPTLPDDELIWRIQDQGHALLAAHGYAQYEVSSHARPGQGCRHNLNYWRFGDYLGIGPGAHGKLSLVTGKVRRSTRQRHPRAYLAAAGKRTLLSDEWLLTDSDLLLEFLLNSLRLAQGFSLDLFSQRTGLDVALLELSLTRAVGLGLLERDLQSIRPSRKGLLFLNDLLQLFLDDTAD